MYLYIRIKNDLKYMCIILTELLAEYISINIFVSSTKSNQCETQRFILYSLTFWTLWFQLYKSAQQNRPEGSGPLQFVPLKASFGYGHKHIFQAPELPEIIKWVL